MPDPGSLAKRLGIPVVVVLVCLLLWNLVGQPIWNELVGTAGAQYAKAAWGALGWRELTEGTLAVLVPIGAALAWWLRGILEARHLKALADRLDHVEAGMEEAVALATKVQLLIRLDDGLVRALPQLLPRQDRETALRPLVREWLRDCAAIFAPDVSRVTLLRPVNVERLEPWESYGMPDSSLAERCFYIGREHAPARRRGIAGEVFISGKHRVVDLGERDGLWVASDDAYIDFEGETRFPRYLTFVAVPIVGHRERPIGVLCLDSKTVGIFGHEPLLGLLLALGQRIGVAVELAETLQELDAQ